MSQRHTDWWKNAILYQIYPRSFYDANADGIGDLKGVLEKLPYLKNLGVEGIWLSPFFPSPMKDFGYDVSNYTDIDPIFGSLEDFDRLVFTAHEMGMKILIDLVLSHTSDQHPWFKESRKNKTNDKADWYVWADAKPDGSPPNNWLSIFGGTAWTWDPHRGQYYMHNFLKEQPDLNFHCPAVQDALLDVTKFWLEKGVDGFRLDTVNFYTHDDQLRDNPARPSDEHLNVGVFENNPYAFQYHIYDKSRPENLQFLKKFRALLDQYPGVTTIGEIGDDDSVARACEYVQGNDKLHMAYTFNLLHDKFNAQHVKETIEEIESQIGDGWPCWSFGNHDTVRAVTRFNVPKKLHASCATMLCALLLSMRGTPIIYQGEELGLEEAELSFEELQDPYGIAFYPEFKGRDGCRTPLPWNNTSTHADKNTPPEIKPWLPVPSSHLALAINVQEEEETSILNLYRQLCLHYHKDTILQLGTIHDINANNDVLEFSRTYEGKTRRCIFNCSQHDQVYPYSSSTAPVLSHGVEIEANQAKLAPYGFLIV